MAFFRPREPFEPPVPPRRPAWMGPHPGSLGGFVPLRVELARTATVHVSLGPMSAHADGVELVLEVRSRSPVVGPMLGPDEGAGSMRFGVELADGRSTESNFPAMDRELTPEDGPILMPRGGGGGGGLYRQEYWLWPLPPAGRTTFAFVWDDAGIPESLTSIDGAVLHLAADEGEQLWEPLTPEEEQAAAHAALRQMSAGRAFRSTGLMFGSGTSKTEE